MYIMKQSVAIKDIRNNLASYVNLVEKGEIIEVYRRSKLVCKIVPPYQETDQQWETIVDFTNKGTQKGAKLADALHVLKKMNV